MASKLTAIARGVVVKSPNFPALSIRILQQSFEGLHEARIRRQQFLPMHFRQPFQNGLALARDADQNLAPVALIGTSPPHQRSVLQAIYQTHRAVMTNEKML
jgi:hypothetical protein